MKPLDLNVSIQNTYEAARSESVRLEKPLIQNKLALENARHDQIVRDESVAASEPKVMQEDEYDEPNFNDGSGDGSASKRQRAKPKVFITESDKTDVAETSNDNHDGFSTYA